MGIWNYLSIDEDVNLGIIVHALDEMVIQVSPIREKTVINERWGRYLRKSDKVIRIKCVSI